MGRIGGGEKVETNIVPKNGETVSSKGFNGGKRGGSTTISRKLGGKEPVWNVIREGEPGGTNFHLLIV